MEDQCPKKIYKGTVNLILSDPPFLLIRKKLMNCLSFKNCLFSIIENMLNTFYLLENRHVIFEGLKGPVVNQDI